LGKNNVIRARKRERERERKIRH